MVTIRADGEVLAVGVENEIILSEIYTVPTLSSLGLLALALLLIAFGARRIRTPAYD